MVDDFEGAESADLSAGKVVLQRPEEAAEKAERELSAAITTNISLPFITAAAERPRHLDTNLTGTKLDELTHDLVERMATPVQNALEDTGITASEFGKVLLTGGPTRVIVA